MKTFKFWKVGNTYRIYTKVGNNDCNDSTEWVNPILLSKAFIFGICWLPLSPKSKISFWFLQTSGVVLSVVSYCLWCKSCAFLRVLIRCAVIRIFRLSSDSIMAEMLWIWLVWLRFAFAQLKPKPNNCWTEDPIDI